MTVKTAAAADAPLVHDIMIKAFSAYRDAVPPSTALDETAHSVAAALEADEQAFICFSGGEPAGMVRIKLYDESIYFFRLSVIPEKQGLGVAKELLQHIEQYARQQRKMSAECKVRGDLPENIRLYESIGYHIYDEELMDRENGVQLKVVSMRKRLG